MDITAIIYGAIGGGGGAFLGGVVASIFSKSKNETEADVTNIDDVKKVRSGIGGGLTGGLAVVGMFVLPALYKSMILPRIVPLDLTEFVEAAPIYSVIKEQSPEGFKRLTAPLDRVSRNGTATQDDFNKVRAVLFELIRDKMTTANASVLRGTIDIQRLQYEDFKASQPTICTQVVHGLPYPDVSDIISEKSSKLEEENMVKLFTEAPRDANFVVDLERGKMLLEKILAESIEEVGVSNLQPADLGTAENKLEHQKLCDFGISHTTKQLKLDDADLIHVTLYLNSSN